MTHRLSGGQLHRVSLSCALVGDPSLLVLDEPTVGLDPVLREEIGDNLRARADDGTTILVSSHVMEEATRCDDLVLLREGATLHRDPGGTDCTDRRRPPRPGFPAAGPRGGGGVMGQARTAASTAHLAMFAASTARIGRQVRHDPRTLGIVLVAPLATLFLTHETFQDNEGPGVGGHSDVGGLPDVHHIPAHRGGDGARTDVRARWSGC